MSKVTFQLCKTKKFKDVDEIHSTLNSNILTVNNPSTSSQDFVLDSISNDANVDQNLKFIHTFTETTEILNLIFLVKTNNEIGLCLDLKKLNNATLKVYQE